MGRALKGRRLWKQGERGDAMSPFSALLHNVPLSGAQWWADRTTTWSRLSDSLRRHLKGELLRKFCLFVRPAVCLPV